MTTSCALLGIEFMMLRHDLAQVKPKQNKGRNSNKESDNEDGPSIETFVKRHQKLLRLVKCPLNENVSQLFEVIYLFLTNIPPSHLPDKECLEFI